MRTTSGKWGKKTVSCNYGAKRFGFRWLGQIFGEVAVFLKGIRKSWEIQKLRWIFLIAGRPWLGCCKMTTRTSDMTMKRKSIPSQLLLSNFFAYFFPNIAIFISIVCLHIHEKKQRKKGVQTIWCCFFSTSPLLSILILFVPSNVNTVLLVPHIAAVCSGHIDDVDAWDSSRNEHGQCWSNGERNFFLRLFAVCIAH